MSLSLRARLERLWQYGEPRPLDPRGSGSVPPTQAMTTKDVLLVALVGMGGVALAVLLRDVVIEAAGDTQLARGNAFVIPSEAMRLYVLLPLAALASFIAFLAPGAIAVLSTQAARGWTEFVMLSFGATLVGFAAVTTGAKIVGGHELGAGGVLVAWGAAGLIALVLLTLRVSRGTLLAVPWRAQARRVGWTVAIVLVATIALLPKLLWEDFNEDGVEAFEFGRSLFSHILPSWEIEGGAFGFYHNYLLFAYPNYWFQSLFGPLEVAARLPFVLYLAVLFSGLVLLVEWGGARALRPFEEGALVLGLAVFAVVMAFNGSYDPFFADIAEPAAPDTLIVVCFLGAAYSLWTERIGWFWTFGLLTFTSGPNGLLLLALLGAVTVVWWSSPRRQVLVVAALGAVCVGVGLAYDIAYVPAMLGGTESQYSFVALLRRLFPPSLGNFERFNVLIFPSGILPALSLLAIRRQDAAARALSTLTLAYFGMLYVQAWTSLHQFTPILVLPLIVFWRLHIAAPAAWQRVGVVAAPVAALVALVLSLPTRTSINVHNREFGLASSIGIGDYEEDYPAAANGARVLDELLPPGDVWKYEDPDPPWGLDRFVWLYYASRPKPEGQSINYLVLPAASAAPAGYRRVGSSEHGDAFVADMEAWRQVRERDQSRSYLSPLYEPLLRRTYAFYRAYIREHQQPEPPG